MLNLKKQDSSVKLFRVQNGQGPQRPKSSTDNMQIQKVDGMLILKRSNANKAKDFLKPNLSFRLNLDKVSGSCRAGNKFNRSLPKISLQNQVHYTPKQPDKLKIKMNLENIQISLPKISVCLEDPKNCASNNVEVSKFGRVNNFQQQQNLGLNLS